MKTLNNEKFAAKTLNAKAMSAVKGGTKGATDPDLKVGDKK